MTNTLLPVESTVSRRLPVGAEVQRNEGVHFRVWAPAAGRVDVVTQPAGTPPQSSATELISEHGGYWSGLLQGIGSGTRYVYRLDGEDFPDPASRFQPLGPHGPSEVIDPSTFLWTDEGWAGPPREGQIIYEMHIGTFTPEGTWSAAGAQLTQLADLGVTMLQVMPLADFPGEFGWGYDGVNLFAPSRLYGSPDEFRTFVAAAHALGLSVVLDVVYNHFGPDGNYLRRFSPHYFSERYKNEWGDALNFDGTDSGPVREFFLANAAYWISEFHLDGLRLDATQQIFDASPRHILAEIAERVRKAGNNRRTYLVAENESQDTRLLRPQEQGGFGLDAAWNDDFHHSATVAITGRNEAYYSDYRGGPQEFISSAKWGYLYQGQRYRWQHQRRGTPSLDLTPAHFVNYLQNHDQIANSLRGWRIDKLTSAARLRVFTALLLLGPNTPMLFQGQEFAASGPFLYFADHHSELARVVAKGRIKFLSQFPSIATQESQPQLSDPEDRQTFLRCKLNFSERERHADIYLLHRDLIHLRRGTPLLGHAKRGQFDGAVLGASAFVLRFFGQNQDDRLLAVNLGPHLHLDPAPEPLLAPPLDCEWQTLWSSEDPRYGGGGTPPLDSDDNWHLPAESAVLLGPLTL